MDPVIPPYLRYEGKVRNLRLSRREISVIINDIWLGKKDHIHDISMQDYVTKYFEDRFVAFVFKRASLEIWIQILYCTYFSFLYFSFFFLIAISAVYLLTYCIFLDLPSNCSGISNHRYAPNGLTISALEWSRCWTNHKWSCSGECYMAISVNTSIGVIATNGKL